MPSHCASAEDTAAEVVQVQKPVILVFRNRSVRHKAAHRLTLYKYWKYIQIQGQCYFRASFLKG